MRLFHRLPKLTLNNSKPQVSLNRADWVADIEALEERVLLTAYVIDSIVDDASGLMDGFVSLREALIAADTNAAFGDALAGSLDGDSVSFSSSLANQTMLLSFGQFLINDDVLINGGNVGITLDGTGISQIFGVNTSEQVTITNLELTGGFASDAGGAISITGPGTTILSNLDIHDNVSGGAGGGAIFIDGGTVQISDSNITMNDAAGGLSQGGGLLINTGDVTITGSDISSNVARRSGGGIEVVSANLTLANCVLGGSSVALGNTAGPTGFESPGNGGGLHVSGAANVMINGGSVQNNFAAAEGGGLWNSATGTMTLNQVSVTDNIAAGDAADEGGGGLFNDGGELRLFNSTVVDNHATGDAGSGGGIFSTAGTLTMNTTMIDGNTANRAGGGIEVIDGVAYMFNATIKNNVAGPLGSAAPGNGGGLHVSGASADVDVVNTVVMNNTAASEGGGLWNQAGSVMTIRNGSTISENVASGNDADNGGGGIFNNGGILRVLDSTVSGNSAIGTAGSGGGIFSTDGITTVLRSTVSSNVANRAGGGIEVIDGAVRLTNSILGGATSADGNIAGPMGSAAPGNGGGLHITGSSGTVAIIENGSVQNNVAASEGGGLWNQTGSTMIVRSGADIVENTAKGAGADEGGGGIFNNGGILRVFSSTVSGNSASGASGSGGGIFSTGGELVTTDAEVSNNTSNHAGGGIEIAGGKASLFRTDVSNNVAGKTTGSTVSGLGGGIHNSGSGTITTLDYVTFDANIATSNGGAIWNSESSTLTIRNGSEISGNSATGINGTGSGGGIYNDGGAARIFDSTISGNSATGNVSQGGGIYSDGGVLVAQRSVIDSNTASKSGGGIEIAGGSARLTNTTLGGFEVGQGNSAVGPIGNGGGLHVSASISDPTSLVIVENSRVANNSANREGGGLWNAEGTHMLIRAGSFIANNTASGNASHDGGGGIFNDGGDLSVLSSTLSGNIANGASGSGGGIFSTDGSVFVNQSTIKSNVAIRAGGGIEIVDGTLRLVNSRLGGPGVADGNVAGPGGSGSPGSGGGIHVSGNDGTLVAFVGGLIQNNRAASEGGGMWNQAGSRMVVRDGTNILGNTAMGATNSEGGGGIFNNGGDLFTQKMTIRDNEASGAAGRGGGIYNAFGGTVTYVTTTVDANNSGGQGGGIFNAGTFNSNLGGKITNNVSATVGGGIFTTTKGVSNLGTTIISGNTP